MSEPERRRIVVVTGLSGGGKASVLHALEDAGYDAIDNPPLRMLEDMVIRSDRKVAVGIDARTSGTPRPGWVAGTGKRSTGPPSPTTRARRACPA